MKDGVRSRFSTKFPIAPFQQDASPARALTSLLREIHGPMRHPRTVSLALTPPREAMASSLTIRHGERYRNRPGVIVIINGSNNHDSNDRIAGSDAIRVVRQALLLRDAGQSLVLAPRRA